MKGYKVGFTWSEMKNKIAWVFCLTFMGCANLQNKKASEAIQPANTPIMLSCEMVNHLCYLKGAYNTVSNLWLVLDTGSSQSVLNSSKKDLLGLKPVNAGRAGGPGNDDSSNYLEFNSIDVFAENKLLLKNQNIISLPFDYVSKQNGHPTDGTLGANIFLNYSVAIDYVQNTVTLDKPGAWKSIKKEESIPITLNDSVPVVNASILLPGGKKLEGKFLIDSGQSGVELVIFEAFLKTHRELSQYQNSKVKEVLVVGGKSKFQYGEIPNLKIGSFVISKLMTIFPIGAAGVYSEPGLAGAIGADVLSRFHVVFDYASNRMILSPGIDSR